MTNDDLLERLLALPQEDLDELVHDLKSREASDINNQGPDGQVDFLIQELGLVELARQFDLPAPTTREFEVCMHLTADALMTWSPVWRGEAASKEEAEHKASEWAREHTGDYAWKYEGLVDGTTDVDIAYAGPVRSDRIRGMSNADTTDWDTIREEDNKAARVQVEKELHEAGIIEDPDTDGGLLG